MALLGKGANKSVRSSNFINGISRTKCPRHFKWRSTFSAGYLIPMFCDEFLPAETKSVDFGTLLRTITPLGPTMDNMFLDVFCFFVPRRLVWDHWEEFIAGYNKEAWAQDVEYTVPKIKFKTLEPGSDDDWTYDKNSYAHSFLDYMPGATDPVDLINDQYAFYEDDEVDHGENALNHFFAIDACYPRSFVKLYNDWFRDENLQDELELYTGDDDEYADEFAFDLLDGTKLPKAAKYHNRFTTALPAPQKGPDVLIPMNNLALSGDIPIGGISTSTESTSDYRVKSIESSGLVDGVFAPFSFYTSGASANFLGQPVIGSTKGITASNLTNTIRMLRLATQTELLLARDARGGTRYIESLLSHFGVHNGDARLQRAEYLGSRQIPLNIMQVTNTAGTSSDALGNVGGQSCTKDNAHYFTYSATEHGILWIVGVVRVNLSYSSGIRKIYQRFGRFDHIWPEFKHIGDVPLYKKEIETNELETGDEVFGYTPYGSELREGYNFNNGLFRYKFNGNFSYLTFQEQYNDDAQVNLNGDYIESSDVPVKNTLIEQKGPQFYGLFDLYMEDTIPLDPTSDPGLMDHF